MEHLPKTCLYLKWDEIVSNTASNAIKALHDIVYQHGPQRYFKHIVVQNLKSTLGRFLKKTIYEYAHLTPVSG